MDLNICSIRQTQSSIPLQKSTNAKKLEDAGASYRTLQENLLLSVKTSAQIMPSSEEHCSVNEIQQFLVQK